MSAHDFDQLAAKLRAPPSHLVALAGLTAPQLTLLSDLIDAACAREQRAVAAAFEHALPALPRALMLELLAGRER